MSTMINLNTRRAKEARLGKTIGATGYKVFMLTALVLAAAAIVVGITENLRLAFILASIAVACYLPAVWWKKYLSVLPPEGDDINSRLSGDVLASLKPSMQLNPQNLWLALMDHWQVRFMLNHLLLDKKIISEGLSSNEADLGKTLQAAVRLSDSSQSKLIEPGFIAAALILSSPANLQLLTKLNMQPEDVESATNWLGRNLTRMGEHKRRTGGIGRDWAFGFTPLLDRLGHNISQGILQYGAHFGWLTKSKGVADIEAAFNNHAGTVALIGPTGIGKTNTIYALAQRLIEGQTTGSLAYHQVVSLSAGDILSAAGHTGQLESLMLNLANETAHAGNIILFLDEAQLFFDDATGSFDATRLLLPIVEARSVPIIMAMTPEDYQRLKSTNSSLASLLTPVMLQEPSEPDVMHVLEDTALGLEVRNKVLVAYQALKEAYRLSGRYEQTEAYPGKAVKLLEQSVAHSQNSIVTALSVQQAIEQTRGVKISSAAPAEADSLLHLEDQIHARMINQTHAVSVVANALRRARAGVANPRRPIGSFLFLGPTGVGKTELTKAIAATYFKSEDNMLRLDMSEYQQAEDVSRLLDPGQDTQSLVLQVREQPFSVVLLDEIEKAHPNILNLLLQLLDEGQLTDSTGKAVSFKDCIIIATSNAGAQAIRERVAKGEPLESFQQQFTDELINSGQFKPELLNRFDEIVLFGPLNNDELSQVVVLMINEINQTLANQNITVQLTPEAIAKIVAEGNDPRLGARPMRRALQRAVENTVAQKILSGQAQAGDHLTLDVTDLTGLKET